MLLCRVKKADVLTDETRVLSTLALGEGVDGQQ